MKLFPIFLISIASTLLFAQEEYPIPVSSYHEPIQRTREVPTKWEYKIVQNQMTEESMNALGEQGWELVSLSVTESSSARGNSLLYNYVFKRQKNTLLLRKRVTAE
ncbi:DUF4177 domain-containing protein [Cerasicoccus arenae]|uniref:DUF4177 domain-containing protein n=1 Tax=Cerasicoccus arenae TaxID=424488 RepID=A0A8J3DAB0_9BACT|nr:DUF4177 domain-containing protein [Cerasicoccus arenae]MBK1859956.1 DUF4177 domain-containing protein [Cerasicoccus arenae]GHC01471.1 hypothetical protein GCM10007047_17440 [Cerasicoccus arenae]